MAAQATPKRVLVMSSDNHAGASAAVYRGFLESRHHDDYDRWLESQRGKIYGLDVKPGTTINATMSRQGDPDRAQFGMNLNARLAMLETEGVVGEVLFPNPGSGPRYDDYGVPFAGLLGGSGGTDFGLLAAGQRAHNRWQAETADLSRQVGLALISCHDVDAAITEIERSAASGLRGVLLQGIHPDLAPLDDPIYDPMWAVCAALDLPVHFHEVSGALTASRATGPRTTGRADFLNPIASYESAWFGQRPFWFMLLGGVFARHPKLRVVFAEMGTEWAINALRDLDRIWNRFGSPPTPEPPSAYFERQIMFGFSRVNPHEVRFRREAGIDKLMWGGDHPHISGPWGCTAAFLRSMFGPEGVTETEARAILGENAVRYYGLDAALLGAVADRVGPTPDEVLREADAGDRARVASNMIVI